jgi:4-hydroxy-tetrahydrodipicolinate reductase
MRTSRTKPLGIIVYGACGRMGQTVTRLVNGSSRLAISALVERPDHPLIGRTIAGGSADPHEGHLLLDRIPAAATRTDIVIDFSTKESLGRLIEQISPLRLRLVCGTTGLDDGDRTALKEYARRTAVLYDTNMSFGITVLKHLFRETHAILGSAFDTEIIEVHHRHKKDFPSGTALSLAREVAAPEDIISGRGNEPARSRDKIHIHSVRAGGITGEHLIVFSSDEEVVTLSHSALSRDVFARGALLAAEFLAARTRGLFSMKHVLEKKHA